MAQRNGRRLLKLVNALLDFSRIEAGRMQLSMESHELAGLTAELASGFRSTMDRAGLRFTVDHTPGHTEGSVTFRTPYEHDEVSELMFSGDLLFAGSIGRTDFPGGNPEAFRRTLDDAGAAVTAFRTFPDHHAYTRADVADLAAWARATECLVVTTQKDLVKLRVTQLGGRGLWALRIRLDVTDGQAVLVLSRFAGASHELTDALIINPYDTESLADAIYRALEMPADERQERVTDGERDQGHTRDQ